MAVARRVRFHWSMRQGQGYSGAAATRRSGGSIGPHAAPGTQLAVLALLAVAALGLLLLALAVASPGPLPLVWGTFGSDRPADYQTSIGRVAPVRASVQPAP